MTYYFGWVFKYLVLRSVKSSELICVWVFGCGRCLWGLVSVRSFLCEECFIQQWLRPDHLVSTTEGLLAVCLRWHRGMRLNTVIIHQRLFHSKNISIKEYFIRKTPLSVSCCIRTTHTRTRAKGCVRTFLAAGQYMIKQQPTTYTIYICNIYISMIVICIYRIQNLCQLRNRWDLLATVRFVYAQICGKSVSECSDLCPYRVTRVLVYGSIDFFSMVWSCLFVGLVSL